MFVKKAKPVIVLTLLLIITSLHFIYAYLYHGSYDYEINNNHDYYWQSFSYKVTLLGILAEIIFIISNKFIIKAISTLLLMPSITLSFFFIKTYYPDTFNNLHPTTNVFDYLSIFIIISNCLTMIGVIFLIFWSIHKK